MTDVTFDMIKISIYGRNFD